MEKPLTAQELRIGNLVHPFEIPNKYDLPNESVVSISTGAAIDNAEYFSGIPLSPVWLERMGFENQTNDWVSLHRNGNGEYLYIDTPIAVPIQYVHQLQNLYWCLTGTELSIKQTA